MIHHITAICKDAQVTTDFYRNILGLRLVKVTVNQDDVGTYHIYFGDRMGSPGTVLTFFPWSSLPPGRIGSGMVSAVAFAVPQLDFWHDHLAANKIHFEQSSKFGQRVLACKDPDGLALEIVEHGEPGNWSTVSEKHAISGFYAATLLVDDIAPTARVLSCFGYALQEKNDTLFRYVAQSATMQAAAQAMQATPARQASGAVIDIQLADSHSQGHPGRSGLGTVHHIAFRAKDHAQQELLRASLRALGLQPTAPIDRYYFTSVYCREPGNILFEIATDQPGFTVDEPESSLGSALVLPPRFEPLRKDIEKILPPFRFSTLNQR